MQKGEDIDGAANSNISSENNSILLTENGESRVQLVHNTEDNDGAAETYASTENNSILLTENGRSTVKLSMRSFCYCWTVVNFFKCLNFCLLKQSADTHFNLNSPNIIFENTEWYMHLSVITVSEQNNSKVKEIKIVLESKSNIASDLYIENEVRIVDDDGKVLLSYSPKRVVGTENRKEYYYSFLPLRGTKTFFLPYKLIVRNKFSTLISETFEDTGSSFSKSGNQNVSKSHCCRSNDASSVPPSLPMRSTNKRSVLPRIQTTSWPSFERVSAEMKEFLIPILVVLCVISMSISLVDQDHGAISTNKSNEINHLIFDYAKKLNLIAEAHNLTGVKEKSLEILVLYSKIYNSSDHVIRSPESSDHVIRSPESSDHVIRSPESTDHVVQSPESTDHVVQSPESTDHVVQSPESTDHVVQSPESTDHVVQSSESTDHVMQSSENTDHVMQCPKRPDEVVPEKQSKNSNASQSLVSEISSFVRSKFKIYYKFYRYILKFII